MTGESENLSKRSWREARKLSNDGQRNTEGSEESSMDLTELRERIARWENLHTEFKERLDSPDELAKDLVCFANTDGGQIIVGVAEDRRIVDIDDPDAVNRLVDNVAFNNCEPPITVVQEVLRDDENKVVVVINVPKGDQRPYRTNRGLYYVRKTSGCFQASREELLRLFQATESLYYDETPLPRLSLADLDLDALDRYLETTGQAELVLDRTRLLRNWGLLSGDHPTVAGIVLFGRDPQRHLPFAQINAARFPGTDTSAEPSDRKDLTGRLLEVIEQAERFLHVHLRIRHEIRGFEPEPRPELPEEALREAIVNAVAHRDYTVRGPVRLFILDDRVEVHTPGKAPNTVDEEGMRAGVHVVRNPRIYARLSDAGLVTRAGTGVRRIIRLVREATGLDLGITIRDFEVLLTIPRKTTTQ
jgi:ATP-dependent DNA helicase RecG